MPAFSFDRVAKALAEAGAACAAPFSVSEPSQMLHAPPRTHLTLVDGRSVKTVASAFGSTLSQRRLAGAGVVSPTMSERRQMLDARQARISPRSLGAV